MRLIIKPVKKILSSSILVLWLGCGLSFVYALDSDRDQPIMLDADDFEIDLRTGVRIYRGNVRIQQGSMQLSCDQLTTYMNSNNELNKAICVGNPGQFKQHPQGADNEIIGKGLQITVDQIKKEVVMRGHAHVIQGGNTIRSELITYNLQTETIKASGDLENKEKPARSRLVIQPRKKKNSN